MPFASATDLAHPWRDDIALAAALALETALGGYSAP